MAELDLDALGGEAAVRREAELEVRREPRGVEGIAGAIQLGDDVVEVLLARSAAA